MLKFLGFLLINVGLIFSTSQAWSFFSGCSDDSCRTKKEAVKGGTYVAYMSSGGKWHKFITTKNISIEEAYDNCRLNADNNPSKGILCRFNGFHIYGLAKKGVYRIKIGKRVHTFKNVQKGSAYQHCKRYANLMSPKKQGQSPRLRMPVTCTLNGKLLYTNQ